MYLCHPEQFRLANRPPFLSYESRLLSGLAQTYNSNKRKICAAGTSVITAQFDKIAGSALGEREQHRLSLLFFVSP